MPALNEEDALPVALANKPEDIRVIVIDNGSTDDTSMIAKQNGAEVIAEPERGFGAACKAGLDAAGDAEIVVYMDADGTCLWGDLDSLIEPILRNEADIVLGNRPAELREPGSMPLHVALANRWLATLCNRIAQTTVSDIPPYRAIRRSSLLQLDLQDRSYGWPLEMVIRAGQSNLRVAERPVRYGIRTGTSKVTGTWSGTIKAASRMSQVLWSYRLWSYRLWSYRR